MSKRNLKKTVEHRYELIPRISNVHIKYIAEKPNLARCIFYLYEKGMAGQVELYRHLKTISCTQIGAYMEHLVRTGIVKKIDKHQGPQIDNRTVTYVLIPEVAIKEPEFMQELYTLFNYEFLTTIEKKVFNDPYGWRDVDELENNEEFTKLCHDWGFTPKRALRLMVSSPIFSTKSDGKRIVQVRRAFDESGYRIEELIEEEEPEEVILEEEPKLKQPKKEKDIDVLEIIEEE